ncbi:hypothetical protein EAS54_05935 [Bradyrhizobium guangzhouense]|nr:hypothetical protein EAS54_05935 [Bradyrhizobium guangzhouense]
MSDPGLSCPGRSAALLQRCAAEPGRISPQVQTSRVPALRRVISCRAASGIRELHLTLQDHAALAFPPGNPALAMPP